MLQYGGKEWLLNVLAEFFISKTKANQKESVFVDISHFIDSLQRVAWEKNQLSSKMMLLLLGCN